MGVPPVPRSIGQRVSSVGIIEPPGMGGGEDPATGSAAAALIGLIARHTDNGQHEFRLRQGHEMGRPSLISLQMRKESDQLTHGGIGGHAVIVGEGVLNLGD